MTRPLGGAASTGSQPGAAQVGGAVLSPADATRIAGYRALLVPHNFSLKAPESGLELERDLRWFGGSATLTFTPTKPGSYPFYCDKDSHMKHGMTGTLVVEARR